MKGIYQKIFILFFYVVFGQNIFAQTHQLSLYQTENGLSSNLTKDIVQDKWGFIWVASDEGVSRFDGRTFLNFKKELPINYTKGLFKTKYGRLLIINDLGVLEAISKPDTVIFRTILQGTNNTLDEKKVMYPKEAFEDCKGNIWISEPGSLLRYNAGVIKRYQLPKEMNTTVYTRSFTFAETACGRLYVGAFMGKLLSYNQEKDVFEPLSLPNDYKLFEISGLIPINENTIWVGDRNGVTEIVIKEKIELKKIADVESVSCLAKDTNSGDFWVGTWEKGLHKLENINGKWNIRKFWESKSNTINHLLCDGQKNLWAATDDGIEFFSANTFSRLKLGKANSYIQGVHSEEKEGEGALVCDQEAAYQIIKKGKTYFKNEVYKKGGLLSVTKLNDKIFVGINDNKLIIQEKGQTKEIDMSPYGRAVFFLQSDNNNNVWVCQYGEKRSITKIDKNLKITQYTEKDGLGTFVEVVRVSKNGDVYVGGQGKDTYLYRFNATENKFENISISIKKVVAQTLFKINDLHIDNQNKIWLGSTQGLYLLENKNLTQVDLGKRYNNETIKSVLMDTKDNVWIGTNIGVLKYKNKNAVLFEKTNGLSTVSIGLKGLAQLADGSILLATSNGLNYMIAANEDVKKTPKPIFKSIKVENKSVVLGEKTEEDFDYEYQSTLKVSFISFTYPNERVLYQYKIEGLSTDWSDPTSQDMILLERLPAGKFKLLVRAIQQGNFVWSEPVVFEFVISQPWYVRWWAWILYVLTALILLYVLVRINTYRLHHQKEILTKRINEATKAIAAQAHDLSQTNKELSVQRDALESAYRIIERKNGKILDSIRYAQTIQQIILPSQDFLNRLCDESFVLYKPRDVVSGDFYWAYKQENKWFLAVVDCTGHGVPGAFMSMIAYSLIYRAIKVKHQYNPAKILELLHAETRVVMRQKDGINTDGMDLCLCVLEEDKYNKDEFKLTYSGAKRPLYLIKDNEFVILEECRKSVGGIQSKNIKFENRTVTIKKGDKLYLTTDGLADQNNVDRKKITEKKVQDIIKEIHKLPLTEQSLFIENVLKQHQEGTEQRDDITMLAVKL